MKRPILGRGLDAILPRKSQHSPQSQPSSASSRDLAGGVNGNLVAFDGVAEAGGIFVATDKVEPNPEQPRKVFDPDALTALVRSVQRDGILQPIIVQRTADGTYRIIAGERRWQAARAAGLARVPVIVKTGIDPKEILSLALIENLQREDLNVIEEARAYERLAKDFGLRHEEIAERTATSRASVTNALRLLMLPAPVVEALAAGKITAGQARPLIGLEEAEAIRWLDRILTEGLSARQVEAFRKEKRAMPRRQPKSRVDVADAEERLSRKYGRKVQIVGDDKKGHIRLDYYSKDDLIALAERLLET